MIKKMLFLAIILIGINSFSQVPDYKTIEKKIKDKNCFYYYPKLMERYVSNDTLLNNQDYQHLYLGYVFQPK